MYEFDWLYYFVESVTYVGSGDIGITTPPPPPFACVFIIFFLWFSAGGGGVQALCEQKGEPVV
jgi:hypothetical protein